MPGENNRDPGQTSWSSWNDVVSGASVQILRDLNALRGNLNLSQADISRLAQEAWPDGIVRPPQVPPTFKDLKARYGKDTLLLFRNVPPMHRSRLHVWDYILFDYDAAWMDDQFHTGCVSVGPISGLSIRLRGGFVIRGVSRAAGFLGIDLRTVAKRIVTKGRTAVIMDVCVFNRPSR